MSKSKKAKKVRKFKKWLRNRIEEIAVGAIAGTIAAVVASWIAKFL